jgi:hypothetical protein
MKISTDKIYVEPEQHSIVCANGGFDSRRFQIMEKDNVLRLLRLNAHCQKIKCRYNKRTILTCAKIRQKIITAAF